MGFPLKTGFYTSPHLVDVEERIRINFTPLRKNVFADYVREVHEALLMSDKEDFHEPRYLQFLALVSFHAFLREGVDTAIYECHSGGAFDSTNLIEKPVVTAITSIGEDHIHQLGPSIENIAWHKAGILKAGTPAFTVPQSHEIASVLRARAIKAGVKLKTVEICSCPLITCIQPMVQQLNLSLAIAVTESFLVQKSPDNNPLSLDDISTAMQRYSWPGRFQKLSIDNASWFLDGAHNDMSLQECGRWFAKETESAGEIHRVVIFGHASNYRDHNQLLYALASTLRRQNVTFQEVIFTLPSKSSPTNSDSQLAATTGKLQGYIGTWERLYPDSTTHTILNVQSAVALAKFISRRRQQIHILVTGSLHLVGDFLRILQSRV